MNVRDLSAALSLTSLAAVLTLTPGPTLARHAPESTDAARQQAGSQVARLEHVRPMPVIGPVTSTDQARLAAAPLVDADEAPWQARVGPVSTTDEARAAALR